MSCIPDSTDWGDYAFAELELSVRLIAENLAWSTLASLTGYQIALCPITVRPVLAPQRVIPSYAGGQFRPYLSGGQWRNNACGPVSEFALEGPVGGIVGVWIDGVELHPTHYRVDSGHILVRQDGAGWPTNQSMNIPDGAVGSFLVTYYRGYLPDSVVNRAAGLLAVEYARAFTGDDECRLPSNVVALTRNGVSFEMDAGAFPGGLTEIREVDAIINLYNPNKLRTAPKFMTPESLRRTRTTPPYIPPAPYGMGTSYLGTTPLGD